MGGRAGNRLSSIPASGDAHGQGNVLTGNEVRGDPIKMITD